MQFAIGTAVVFAAAREAICGALEFAGCVLGSMP